MALILVVGSAYLAYSNTQNQKLHQLDPDIDLEGKMSVDLLPLEQTLSLLEAPIATISFFKGDYKVAAEYLRSRVPDIVYRNPWLGGWILQTKDDRSIKLYFDPSSDDVAPGILKVYEPGEIHLTTDTSSQDYDHIVHEATVKSNRDLVGKNEPIWKVTIIPCSDTPNTRFALVVSMSHVGGDAHTFHQVYNMLSKGTEIMRLNPLRKYMVSEAAQAHMGRQETFYIKNAVANPIWHRANSGDNNDALKTRHVYISQTWLDEHLEQATTEEAESVEIVTVSPLSVVSSWFFQQVDATVGLIAQSVRNKLRPMCDVGDLDAGNYQNPIPVTSVDYATPQLVERALQTLKRCGSDPIAPLPSFSWDATYSVSIDWNRFRDCGLDLGDDTLTEALHMPLYNVEKLNEQSHKLSFICIYAVGPGGKDGSKSRYGAMIVAPQSVLESIEASDFVDEVIP